MLEQIEAKTMKDIIVDLTDRLFMSNEEELMEILGWGSIVNLWRVQEAIEELEADWVDAYEDFGELEASK